jgi:regulator of protease activity HflC (stomatin/prohibitin superfamily)
MPKEMQEEIAAEEAAKAKRQQELFNKQEAEREAIGDFSKAPGMTPEQKEAAALKWAREEAAKSIKGATPAPQ